MKASYLRLTSARISGVDGEHMTDHKIEKMIWSRHFPNCYRAIELHWANGKKCILKQHSFIYIYIIIWWQIAGLAEVLTNKNFKRFFQPQLVWDLFSVFLKVKIFSVPNKYELSFFRAFLNYNILKAFTYLSLHDFKWKDLAKMNYST